jgi:hydroxypyruvate isomerase
MPRFAANISMLFTEVPFLDRFDAAADAGFEAVESLFPYSVPALEMKRRLDARGLQQVLLNAPAGAWRAGERGLAGFEDSARFDASIDLARKYASELECTRVHVLTGTWSTANLSWTRVLDQLGNAADRLAPEGITLLLEALNPADYPNYMIDGISRALEVIEAIGRRNVALLFDLYHAHATEADPFERLCTAIERVGHIQFASVPDRAEPDLEYSELWDSLDRLSYSGWVAAEYRPRGLTEEGIGWFEPYRNR